MAETQKANLKLDFIGSLLRKHENDISIKVTEINSKPACEKGDNFMSIVSKVSVKGKKIVDDNEIDFTASLIAKHPFQSEVLHETKNIFNNEAIAYNEVIPALRKHFQNKLPFAECLYAGSDCVILKDLTLDNYAMRSDVCLSINDCVEVLKELAVLHAASVILNSIEPEQITTLSSQIYELFSQKENVFLTPANNSIEITLYLLKKAESSEKVSRAIEFFELHKDDIFNQVSSLILKKYETAVFNHGDCWRNNLLFRNTGGNIEVKLIDLQIMRYTSIAADLSYFLFINLTPETRRANMDYFLEQYFDTFKNCIVAHGVNFDALPFTKEQLIKEMYEFQIFGYIMSTMIAPVFYMDKTSMPEMEDIKPEQLDPEYQKEYYLAHMNTNMTTRIMDIAFDLVENYKY